MVLFLHEGNVWNDSVEQLPSFIKMVSSAKQKEIYRSFKNFQIVCRNPTMQFINWTFPLHVIGQVWCGLTNSGGLIAVKQIELNIDNMDKAEIEYEKIQEEVELLKNLNHRNIVGSVLIIDEK